MAVLLRRKTRKWVEKLHPHAPSLSLLRWNSCITKPIRSIHSLHATDIGGGVSSKYKYDLRSSRAVSSAVGIDAGEEDTAIRPTQDHILSQANLDGICAVRTKEEALRVLDIIYSAPEGTVFACDTEVAHIDATKESPVGKGEVICASIYGGPNIDFDGEGSSCLWIDNLGDSQGVLDLFKGVFASDKIMKVRPPSSRTTVLLTTNEVVVLLVTGMA